MIIQLLGGIFKSICKSQWRNGKVVLKIIKCSWKKGIFKKMHVIYVENNCPIEDSGSLSYNFPIFLLVFWHFKNLSFELW